MKLSPEQIEKLKSEADRLLMGNAYAWIGCLYRSLRPGLKTLIRPSHRELLGQIAEAYEGHEPDPQKAIDFLGSGAPSLRYAFGSSCFVLNDILTPDQLETMERINIQAYEEWPKVDPDRDPLELYELPWRCREALRLRCGYYKSAPWPELSPVADHFAHVSKKNPELIAYTPSATYGERDRQVMMKPGRYLTQFYGQLHGDEVRAMQARLASSELKFAITPDEIEDVYTSGPTSCMSHSSEHFDSWEHPVRAYGNSDLSLAYIEDGEGKPTARALVWEAKRLYGRIYGDIDRLQAKLTDAGYLQGSLVGARIRKVVKDGMILLPYLDDGQRAADDGDWLIVGQGDLDAAQTDGWANLEDSITCDHCEETVLESQITRTAHGQLACRSCVSEMLECHNCGRPASPDDGFTTRDAFRREHFECTMCEASTFCDGREEYRFDVRFVTLHDERNVAVDWARENAVEIFGEWWANDDPDKPEPVPITYALPVVILRSCGAYDTTYNTIRQLAHESGVRAQVIERGYLFPAPEAQLQAAE